MNQKANFMFRGQNFGKKKQKTPVNLQVPIAPIEESAADMEMSNPGEQGILLQPVRNGLGASNDNFVFCEDIDEEEGDEEEEQQVNEPAKISSS
jgi:hypothetical protein